jgi:hypothetical protein
MTKFKIVALATFLLLGGCQNSSDFFDANGNLKDAANFQFEGDVWEISYGQNQPSKFMQHALGATLRRPTRPLQDNEVDQAAAVRASSHYLAPIMQCKQGSWPQEVASGTAGKKWPDAIIVWLDCYR